MPLQKIRQSDPTAGQRVASGNDQYFIPAVVMADSAGGTAVAAASGNVANAAATATIAAAAGLTNYVTGITITGAGATAASVVSATLTGLVGGTQTFTIAVPAGATLGITPLCLSFDPPHPATGANVAIAVSLPALGAGNTNAAVTIRGIQK